MTETKKEKKPVRLGNEKESTPLKYYGTYQPKSPSPNFVLLKPGDKFVDLEYLETNEDGFGNPAHKFLTTDGSIAIFNSAGMLNKRIERIPAGAVVDIAYDGQTKMKGGNASGKFKGKLAHVFRVDSTEILDAPEVVAAAETTSADIVDDEEAVVETTSADIVDDEEAVAETTSTDAADDEEIAF